MAAADTNIIVRLVTRDDEPQYAAARNFVDRGAWVSHVVLAETGWVLLNVYGLDHAEVADAIEMLLNQEQLVIEDSDVVTAALELYRTRPALGFSDCLILEIAHKAGHLPLGTFDRALGKADGAIRL